MAEGWGGGGASQGRAPAGRQGGAQGNCGLQPSQQGQGSPEAVCQQGRHRERPQAQAGHRAAGLSLPPPLRRRPPSLRFAGSAAPQGRHSSPSARRPAIACGLSPCLRCPAGTQPPGCPLSAPAGAVALRASLPACLPRAAAAPAFRPPNKYANIRICKFASMIVESTFIDVNIYIYSCKVTFVKGQHGSIPPVLTPRLKGGHILTAVK